jgi:hypothetical protein
MAPAFIITVIHQNYYNIAATTAFAFLDSLAAFALASVGVAFSLVALLKISSIAYHNLSHALIRHWHFASRFARNFPRHRC